MPVGREFDEENAASRGVFRRIGKVYLFTSWPENKPKNVANLQYRPPQSLLFATLQQGKIMEIC